MPDNLGLNQTRVLDDTDRNFEAVISQIRKPPLSCEANLQDKINMTRLQNTVRSITTSGWTSVGAIVNNVPVSECAVGDVLCSTFSANTINLIATNNGQETYKNTAWVNGWEVLVQASSAAGDSGAVPITNATLNNYITLTSPSAGTGSGSPPPWGIDFVYLEVWRELLDPTDTVYQYGNVCGPSLTNDLIDPARGFETTLRIQTQYRIRATRIQDVNINVDQGFDNIPPQGPMSIPVTGSRWTYSKDISDPGLWKAGYGDTTSQAILGTVDGYIYAIPMFAVARRNSSPYVPGTNSNEAGVNLAGYLDGTASDRPDNLYSDYIVAQDILDLRHKVFYKESLTEMCADAFTRLEYNNLQTAMYYNQSGEAYMSVYRTQSDFIGPGNYTWANSLGIGDGIRNVFSNAGDTQYFALKEVYPSPTWTTGQTVTITPIGASYPAGTTFDFQAAYFNATGDQTNTIVGDTTVSVILNSIASSQDSTSPLIFNYNINYPIGSYGLSEVPTRFLEARNMAGSSVGLPIAFPGNPIPVRLDPLSQGVNIVVDTSTGDFTNMLQNMTGSVYDLYNFGHQMIYNIEGTGSNLFTIDRTLGGYNIIGVADVSYNGSSVPSNLLTVSRTPTAYTVNTDNAVADGTNVTFTLYTGTKFFEVNKQARAITGCYEMLEIVADQTGGGGRTQFTIDASNFYIIALGAYSQSDGTAYAYVTSGGDSSRAIITSPNNTNLFLNPLNVIDENSNPDSTITITLASTPASGSIISVPVLRTSAVQPSENYMFFYEYLPYQGLIGNDAITGNIVATGPSITTTYGSGAITPIISGGGVGSISGSTLTLDVPGLGPGPFFPERIGDIINIYDYYNFRITEIIDSTSVVINYPIPNTFPGGDSFSTYSSTTYFDKYNIIDRFPAANSENDPLGTSADTSSVSGVSDPVIENRAVARPQPFNSYTEPLIGVNSADRGRTGIIANNSPYGINPGGLGMTYESLSTTSPYQKTYQSYIINKNNSGELYMVVVGSEDDNLGSTCYLNPYSLDDVVDYFALPGRPLLPNVDPQ